MGNKVGVLLFTCHKHSKAKKENPTRLENPKRVREGSAEDLDEVYFTPKSHHNETEALDSNAANVTELSGDETDGSRPDFVCGICTDLKPLQDSFNLEGCSHFYCTECMVNFVASKLDYNLVRITCPVSGCQGSIGPEYCRDILPKDVFDRWGFALCESVIDTGSKFYCPYSDCSALLINDMGAVDVSVCPFCKRDICVRCKAPWHSDIHCEKFQKLKKQGEDCLVNDLARRRKWRKCPNCKFLVERSSGCYYIRCRSVFGFSFMFIFEPTIG